MAERDDVAVDPPSDLVTRLVRTVLPVLVVVGVLVVVVWRAAQPLDNYDTYFHLRFGAEFLDGWSLRHPGSVSTFATADWVPTQWLPEVVMAQLERWFGLPGVAWLSGLQMLALTLALYLTTRRRAEPLVVAVVVAVALESCATGLSMRPQVWSYVAVVVLADAWLRSAVDRKARWWLVPLTWVWAMVHGMWPVGLVIGAAAVVGIALDGARGRTLAKLAAVPVASALAAALTPVGPALYPAVLLVASRRDFFGEWGPPSATDPNVLCALLLLAVVAVVALRSGRRSPWTQVVLLLVAGGWVVYSSRTVPVAGCLAAPMAAAALQSLLPRPLSPFQRRERLTAYAAVGAALVVLALLVPHTADEPPSSPDWVAPTLSALPPGTKMLDDWGFGGFLMWRYPHLDLVTSGYGDTFTDSELRRNRDLVDTRPGWAQLVADTHAEYAILPPDSKLAYGLVDLEHWVVLHSSSDVELLHAPAPPV
ncbi:MAG: hypothetical protein ACXVW1_10170 [Nocardioides sp.]